MLHLACLLIRINFLVLLFRQFLPHSTGPIRDVTWSDHFLHRHLLTRSRTTNHSLGNGILFTRSYQLFPWPSFNDHLDIQMFCLSMPASKSNPQYRTDGYFHSKYCHYGKCCINKQQPTKKLLPARNSIKFFCINQLKK